MKCLIFFPMPHFISIPNITLYIRLEFPPEAVEVRGGRRRVLTVEEGEDLPGVLCKGGDGDDGENAPRPFDDDGDDGLS